MGERCNSETFGKSVKEIPFLRAVDIYSDGLQRLTLREDCLTLLYAIPRMPIYQ